MSVHWPILRQLLTHPRRIALNDDRKPEGIKNIEVAVGAAHVAAVVKGVSESPQVAVLLPTSGAFSVAALGVWWAGRTLVPLNYLLKREELAYVLEDCGADTVITAGAMLEFLGYTPESRNLKRVIRLEHVDFHGIPEVGMPALTGEDALAMLLYTSGTSGRPKGVMLTHGNITSNIQQIRRWIRFDAREVLLGVLPQFHSFGMTVLTLLPLTAGCRAVYAARFVPAQIMRLIRTHRPTVMVAIPSMYNALLHAKDATAEDFSSFRFVVSGGEPLPSAVLEGFRTRFGVTIAEGYGLTETSPVSNWCRPWEWRAHSVGRPLPDVRERIVDIETGRDLPAGADGEVRIAGPNVMQGYYKLPKETAGAFDEQGYLRTGDIGRFDADGHLYITGRLKEMLIVGGENVFPREIEEVLNHHPSVKESGVVGQKDPMRGEVPVAFVELKDGSTLDERDIIAWCRKRLAGYKVPHEVRAVAALPRNPTGKVLRRELRGMLAGTA